MSAQIWFHIDVNSAYLSWTAVDELAVGKDRDLRQMAAIIGGDRSQRRGVVLAKSTIAKSYGVRTGEPITDALKKCPDLVIVQPNHKRYDWHSKRLMKILREYSPTIYKYSIDECFLAYMPPDIGLNERQLRRKAILDAYRLKDRIKNELGFTVNVGISVNQLLAKMASDFEKPDKVHTLFPDEIQEKMWPLPVGELFMVGRSSVQHLKMLGIKTIGDLARTDKEILAAHLKSHGRTIWEYANGIETTPLDDRRNTDNKGIGNSTTLAHDVTDRKEISGILKKLSEKVAERLRETGLLAGMICVEIKYYDFRSVSHQAQLLTPTDSSGMIQKSAERLIDELWNEEPIRLLGVRLSKLCGQEQQQLNLFDMKNQEKLQKLDRALDSIRSRFGQDAVMRAVSMPRNEVPSSDDE